jgi:hypothetical protein
MATVTEFALGERVAFSKTLSRTRRWDSKKRVAVKRWEYVESPWLPKPVTNIGVIVGVRVLSNGEVDADNEYIAAHHFTAYVIAYDLRRAHVLVRPEDIKHLDRQELF